MKVLFLTQYYPPETGAPQNRLHDLAVRLSRAGHDVSVLTAMPNYPKMEIYEGYRKALFRKEVVDGVRVFRSWIFVSKSKGVFLRLLNYFSFVLSSMFVGIFRIPRHDIIFCESPPLFLGISALTIKSFKRAKLVFNVSDLWPESAEKLGLVTNKFLLRICTVLEEYCYKKSDLISGQTQGIQQDIKNRFPTKDVVWLPNGSDISRYIPVWPRPNRWRLKCGFNDSDLVFYYGGILGHAQGLEIILDTASRFGDNVKFVIMGSGPLKQELLAQKEKQSLDNVFILDGVPKSEMANILSEIDAAIVPLRKLELFLGAIPSKIFDVLAMEKPIVLGVDGEAKKLFVDQGNCAVYFEPEDRKECVICVQNLVDNPDLMVQLGKNGSKFVRKHFDRQQIALNFEKKLTKLLNDGK